MRTWPVTESNSGGEPNLKEEEETAAVMKYRQSHAFVRRFVAIKYSHAYTFLCQLAGCHMPRNNTPPLMKARRE